MFFKDNFFFKIPPKSMKKTVVEFSLPFLVCFFKNSNAISRM